MTPNTMRKAQGYDSAENQKRCNISQWEIHHGTRPAPIPAAMRRKSADPKAAGILPAGGSTEVTLGHWRTTNHYRLLLRPETFKGRVAQSVLLSLPKFHVDHRARLYPKRRQVRAEFPRWLRTWRRPCEAA